MAGTPEHPIGAGKLTYEDLVSLPEDGKRYEILDGDLAVTPSPLTLHQRVSLNLSAFLHGHVKSHHLGTVLCAPMDVILDEHTVVEPDILFVSTGRSGLIQKHAIVGPPDLVVEILSSSTARRDRGVKSSLYARFGVDHYWIVDADQCAVEVFMRAGHRYTLSAKHVGDSVMRSLLFPDLAIELRDIWE